MENQIKRKYAAEKSRAEFCKFAFYLIFPHQPYKKMIFDKNQFEMSAKQNEFGQDFGFTYYYVYDLI